MYRINKHNSTDKKTVLLKQNRQLFHTQDLALLWGITKRDTLYTTIKRYVQGHVLISIHKGFYSTIPLSQVDPIQLGISYLHTFAYLSTESILTTAGIINQQLSAITLISNKSKEFEVNNIKYISRQLNPKYLYNYQGLMQQEKYLQASVERAVADLLYYNPKYYFDQHQLINWDQVKTIQKGVGYI